MIKSISFLCFFFLLIHSAAYSQNAQELYSKAQELFDKARYEESLLYLKNCEKAIGSNPRIQSLKILCYNYLGDVKNTKISLIGYFQMVSPEYEITQAHKNLVALNQKVDEQIAEIDKEKNRIIEEERSKTAIQYQQKVNLEINTKKDLLKNENKKVFSEVLNQNASIELKSKIGVNVKELEVLGVDFKDYQKSKLVLSYGTYIGELDKGIPSGNGTMSYKNGDEYNGKWIEGKRSGQGVQKYKSGDVYTGSWENDKKNGHGLYVFNNKNFYEGQWVDDYTIGNGKYVKTNGDYCIGTFKEMTVLVSGKIKTTLTSGDDYEGDFLNGEYTGEAEIKYLNGNRYKGSVKNGLKDGTGTLYLINGNWIVGVWSQDKKKSGRKHFLQKARLGTGYLGITYAGMQPSRTLGEIPAPLQLSFDGGYIGRWCNVGANLGYFKQNEYLKLNGQNNLNAYGNIYLGANAGPNFAILKDHIILKLNYQFGFVPKTVLQVDHDDMLSNDIIYVKPILIHDYQAELFFRWGQTAYGIFYKYSMFKDLNTNLDQETKFTVPELPNQNGIIGFKFIALFSN